MKPHQMLQPASILPPANDLRFSRDPEKFARAVADARVNGIRNPVHALKRADGKLQMLDGETRRLIAIEAGVELPVIVRDTPLSEDEAEKEAYLGNDLRSDFSPVERASLFVRRMQRNGWNQKQLADDLGISEAEVSRCVRVFRKLPQDVLELVARGELAGSTAAIVASLDTHEQMRTVAAKKPKRDAAVKMVRAMKGKGEKKRAVKVKADACSFSGKADYGVLRGFAAKLAKAVDKCEALGLDPAQIPALLAKL